MTAIATATTTIVTTAMATLAPTTPPLSSRLVTGSALLTPGDMSVDPVVGVAVVTVSVVGSPVIRH